MSDALDLRGTATALAAPVAAGLEAGRRTYGAFDLPAPAFAARILACGKSHEELVLQDLYLGTACDAGDEKAWATLEREFLPRLQQRARGCRIGPARAEAEATALLGDLALPPPRDQARTLIGTYDGSGSLYGWLTVILVRRIFRKKTPRPTVTIRASDNEVAREERTGAEAPPAWERLVNHETAERLRRGMAEAWQNLSDQETLVLVFKHGHGLSQRKIASLLSVSEPTCSRIATGALAKVRATVQRALGTDDMDASQGDLLWRELEQVVSESMQDVAPPDEESQ